MLSTMRIATLALLAWLLAACGAAGAPLEVALPTPAGSPVAATPSPTASPAAGVPASAGAVPDAGVLYVWGADDGIYRYDGATGAVARVSGASTLAGESPAGPYVLGRHGGMSLLKWDGTAEIACPSSGYAAISSRGGCAYSDGPGAVHIDDGSGPRLLLPASWSASGFVWSPDGAELVIVRHESRPEPVRGHQTLWHLDRRGQLSKIFDSSSATSFLYGITWSNGRRLSFLEQDSTSASAGADGANIRLRVIDVDTRYTVDLGHLIQGRAWVRWSADGQLAFVRGGDRYTWTHKELAVLDRDWNVRVVAGGGDTIALAPAWQPVGPAGLARLARLAWIAAPDTDECCQRYVAGVGPSADRVAVLETASGTLRLTCPGQVTEGVRWAADGSAVLLLCRASGVERRALSIWYAPLGGVPRALVTGLGDLGFGFYGAQPSLFTLVAWSLGDR
jgi:hypothetical protein